MSRRLLAIGIVLIALGVSMVLRGAATDSAPHIVAGGLELLLGTAFVAASRRRSGENTPTDDQPAGQVWFEPPVFTSTLRGYEKRQVDELIGRCEGALSSGQASRIEQARAELDRERGTLPIALNGYDRGQVDDFLDRLLAVLGQWCADGDEPEAS